MDFPEYYGENWPAFWDCIRRMRDNTIIEIRGMSTLPKDFAPHMEKMIEILERNKQEMQQLKKRRPQFDCRFAYRIID